MYLIGVVLLLVEKYLVKTMMRDRGKLEAAMERFQLIKNHPLENNRVWSAGEPFPAGFSESRLLLSV